MVNAIVIAAIHAVDVEPCRGWYLWCLGAFAYHRSTRLYPQFIPEVAVDE